MAVPVLHESLHGDVQLLRPPELGEVRNGELAAGMHGAAAVRRELHGARHLRLADDALADVRGVAAGVLDGEGVRAGHRDLPGLGAVQLGHALHLAEGDVVAVLEAVPLVLVARHCPRVLLADAGHNRMPWLFAILVEDRERVAVVDKGGARNAKAVSRDEANRRGARTAELIVLDEVSSGHAGADNHRESGKDLLGEGSAVDADRHVGVELREHLHARLRASPSAHVRLREVEVGAQVAHLGQLVVMQYHGSRPGEDQILGDLHAQPPEADDQHLHLDQLPHGLHTEGSDLPTV
mmetsp:Transcript_39870/g.105460  ORF Transcript_39870/g.105460 Transcript_39870/m.105460 type:complete len:295 (+) Transcript_39870:1598-2482(+)